MFENLTSVENSLFVVNSENIRLSPLFSNSRSASSSSVGVDNLSSNKEFSLNELTESNNVNQRDKVVDSGHVSTQCNTIQYNTITIQYIILEESCK